MHAWRGAAFGLELRGNFPAPGFATSQVEGTDGRQASLTTSGSASPQQEEEVFVQPLPGGSFSVHRGELGYDLSHSYYGRFRVSADGTQIDCSPTELVDWHWQRFLVGQLLPLAATLQGIEPLHASAVELGDSAALVMGTSGAGKSSVALHLAAGEGTFIADDVAALELVEGEARVHPGPGLASIDPQELARLSSHSWEPLGEADGEVRLAIGDLAGTPALVGAIYVLVRQAEGELQIREPRVGAPEVLLGGTFNAYVNDSERLVRQLELSARLAETARVREVTVPPESNAADVAAAIAADLR